MLKIYQMRLELFSSIPALKVRAKLPLITSNVEAKLMTRILIPLLFVLLLSGTVVSSGQAPSRTTNKVPAGKTYVYLDKNGKVLKTKKPGESTGDATTGDCVIVTCPPKFDKKIVCWQCKKREVEKAPK